MKKSLSFILVAAACIGTSVAQQVREDGIERLRISYTTPRVITEVGEFSHIAIDGYYNGGMPGTAALPVRSDYIVVPFCDGVEVAVLNAVYDTLPLSAPVEPRQPSASKRLGFKMPSFFDSVYYATPGYHPHPLAEVVVAGVARDRNIATINYSPVWVNTVEGRMVVCRKADIEVRYINADDELTRNTYNLYHTPAFNPIHTLNSLPHATKIQADVAPTRMVILAAEELRCSALDRFAEWKRSQGLIVDIIYVEKGKSAQNIASMLKETYFAASSSSPAPTYVLLVGDHEQLPAFASNMSSNNYMNLPQVGLNTHITDHYYTTFTDDRLPDCYRGRFPSADTLQLASMIDKTIYYESYQFKDDSYLNRAALVAGIDQIYYRDPTDEAFRCADPTMDYIAKNYVNSSNGFTDITYYKNNDENVPEGVTVTGNNRGINVASDLRSLYNEGVGWINYSAHGDIDEWTKPNLCVDDINGDTTINSQGDTTRKAAGMSNYDKPSFMIGNCCLSNHFDTKECFGEALLRRGSRAGAIGYIGCTNSSFWDEDLFWSVGVREDVGNSMSLDYIAENRGMYDHLFHTHGETYLNSAVTAGSMLLAGQMEVWSQHDVDAWGKSAAEYYSEIYQLMGDPTLLPWLGQAKELTNVKINQKPNEQQLVIEAPQGAYVAMVQQDNLEVVAAAYAWTDGNAYLPLDNERYANCYVSITAQGYKPYRKAYTESNVSIDEALEAATSLYPNPAAGYCTVSAPSLRSVAMVDAVGRVVLSQQAVANNTTINLSGIRPGVYIVQIETAQGSTVRKLVVL